MWDQHACKHLPVYLLDRVFIATWLRWSCSCVSFEIEITRWRCRSSSIVALDTTISAMAVKCALDFRFETVALR